MNSIVFSGGRQIGRTHAARLGCHLKTIEKPNQNGYSFDCADLERIERAIVLMSPAFVRPGWARYRLTIPVHGQRSAVIYDTVFPCLVTCRPAPRLGTVYEGEHAHE